MEIRQLRYLIEIVNSNFNLSVASEKLYVSQPALSMGILKFEREERIELLVRKKGLIVGLTLAGETFFNNALKVIELYDMMMEELRKQSSTLHGKIRIGVPPLIATVLCTEFLNELVATHASAEFIIEETGAYDLEKKLQLAEIDSAFLLKPSGLSPDFFNEVLINTDELSAFMSKDHRLAKQSHLKWQDLSGESLVIFDETYMIHHKLVNKFKSLNMKMHYAMMSKSWDFLLESVKNTQYVTILPSPISQYYNPNDLAEVKFEDPIPWEAIYVYPQKAHYSRIEEETHQEVINYYLHKKVK